MKILLQMGLIKLDYILLFFGKFTLNSPVL